MPKVARLPANYAKNAFINCPFDEVYEPIFNAIVFAVNDMGFRPKSAKDESNAGNVRFNKIQDLISECKYSIHDISRTRIGCYDWPAKIQYAAGAWPRFGM